MEKPICRNCGSNNLKERKSWKLKGGKGGVNFRVHLYECISCGTKRRLLERI